MSKVTKRAIIGIAIFFIGEFIIGILGICLNFPIETIGLLFLIWAIISGIIASIIFYSTD